MYLFCRSYFVRVVAFVITLPARSSPLLSFWDMGVGGEIFRASNFDAHFAVGFFLLSFYGILFCTLLRPRFFFRKRVVHHRALSTKSITVLHHGSLIGVLLPCTPRSVGGFEGQPVGLGFH